jgi:selenide,water dikinase
MDDAELKYGLSVTGTVHPEKVVTNRGAREGDVLILTKPLGIGIISTAHKAQMAEAPIFQGAIDSMIRLNGVASEVMVEYGVHACTDVTGFGLLGHASEMAKGCGLSFQFFYSRIAILAGAKEFAAQGIVPGGAYCNQDYFSREIAISSKVPEPERIILFDPQTSGGLLIALPSSDGGKLLRSLKEKGIPEASLIGEVIRKEKNLIIVE